LNEQIFAVFVLNWYLVLEEGIVLLFATAWFGKSVQDGEEELHSHQVFHQVVLIHVLVAEFRS